MQLMAGLVGGRQINATAIKGKAAVGDTVRVTAYGSAEIGGLARIVGRGRAAEQRFAYAAVGQRHARGEQRRAPVHYGDRHACVVTQGEEIPRLAVRRQLRCWV